MSQVVCQGGCPSSTCHVPAWEIPRRREHPPCPALLDRRTVDGKQIALPTDMIGEDQVRFLQDGMKALADRPDLVEATPSWSVEDWERAIEEKRTVRVLDVRSPTEYKEGHVRDALHIPLTELAQRLDEIPRDGELLVHCAGGYRSTIACSLLQRAGRTGIINLLGGINAITKDHTAFRELVTEPG